VHKFNEIMIQAIIFDLDGTIIDSEPLWQEAEISIFAEEGLNLTNQDCIKTMGLQTYQAVKYWHNKIPVKKRSVEELTDALNAKVMDLIKAKGEIKPGVRELIEMLYGQNIKLAIASSSTIRLIETVVNKFNLRTYFPVISSGDYVEFGKPNPEIFLLAASELKADPLYCIAIEDSFNGMIAAKAARMKLIAYLDDERFHDTKYDFADLKLESFHNFSKADLEQLQKIM
jgi:mannitol-1-/sugar-/sorbitol-6-/2-deoxyglucose-6-phosphatase